MPKTNPKIYKTTYIRFFSHKNPLTGIFLFCKKKYCKAKEKGIY